MHIIYIIHLIQNVRVTCIWYECESEYGYEFKTTHPKIDRQDFRIALSLYKDEQYRMLYYGNFISYIVISFDKKIQYLLI